MHILRLTNKEKIPRNTYRIIQGLLRDYPDIEKYIQEREMLLQCPYYDEDENVGGGKAQNKKDDHVERLAISIADDKYLTNLRKNKKAIEKCLKESDETTQRIIEELYFKHDLTLTGVAHREHLSISQVGRRRSHFFKRLGQELGLL